MPYPNEHSARLREPGDFKEKPDWAKAGGKFRRVSDGKIYGKIKVPETADVIWGQLKNQSGKSATPQAIRFPIKNWTAKKAKKWLKDNRVKYIKFEPASAKKDKNNSKCITSTPDELKAIKSNWQGFIETARQKAIKEDITITEAMRRVRKENPQLYQIFRENAQ